ncbi:DedA family protein, putative, partial [hydrothermal vent metagenome]
GAALAFLVARYMASGWVERKVGGKLKKLYDGVEEEGWRFVAFTRLVPVFPFNLLNYALGLTRIKFSHYVISTFIFMAPGGIAYTYLGYAGKEALAGGEGLIQKGLMALGLLALAAFLPRFITRMRKESDTDASQACDLPGNEKIETRLTQKERKRIEKSIFQKYTKVATSPEGLFKYPTGLAGLETLEYNRDLVRALPDIVAASYCGVGNPFSLGSIGKGAWVLDIGCGAGVDTVLAAMIVGPDGKAAGVDMSAEMLARARENADETGLGNVTFKKVSAEELPFADGVFDVVISNSVFNLVVDKYKALKEVFRTLKPGGRLMMADQTLIGAMPRETAVMVKNWGR